MKTTLLFDIDGTLLLTGGVGATAFDLAFSHMFEVENAWGDTKAHGRTDPDLIFEISSRSLGKPLASDEYLALKSSYITYFEASLPAATNFRLMPGTRELLETLSSKENIALGIETGNFKETALLKLGWKNIAEQFSFGGYACDSNNRSEIVRIALERSPQSSVVNAKTVVIGDSLSDVKAAKDNSALAVLILTRRHGCR